MLPASADDFLEVMIDRANYEFEMKVHAVGPEDPLIGKTLRESFHQRAHATTQFRYDLFFEPRILF